MSAFWANNIHFAVEFFGATVLVVAAWLALDAYALTREGKALAKVAGFLLFAAAQVIHALDVTSDLWQFTAVTCLVVGILLVLLNVYLEKPPGRPESFQAVFVFTASAPFLTRAWIAAALAAAGVAAVALSRRISERNTYLQPLWIGFGLLALSFLAGAASLRHLAVDGWWIAEHALRAAAFASLGVWVWQYMLPRLKEELLLVFVAMSLIVSLVVTFTFSALLLGRMRTDATDGLAADARVFAYAVDRMQGEAVARAEALAASPRLGKALIANDFAVIEDIARSERNRLQVDFLTVGDAAGGVVQRAAHLTRRGDAVSAVSRAALLGASTGDLLASDPEGFGVRGAAPLMRTATAVAGVVEAGFTLDGAFLEGLKKVTGLDMTVFSGKTLYATTITDPSGAALAPGSALTDAAVADTVLTRGASYTGSLTFLGRSHLVSYVPLRDAAGTVVGIAAASRPEVEIAKAALATNRLTLLTTLIIVLILLLPAYLVVKKVSEEA